MSIEHKDIPDAQLHKIKGAATATVGQIPIANGSGDAPFATPPFTKARVGFWDYNDTATTTTPISLVTAGTEYTLTNNGAGVNTLKTYGLPGITDIFNTATNYFDFSGLKLGDTIDIRVDLDITTASANNIVDLIIEAGIGVAPYKLTYDTKYFKTASTHKIVARCSIYVGNDLTKNNPARLLIKNDTAGSTVKVNGWYTRVLTNG